MSTLEVPKVGPVDFTNDDNGYWEVTAQLGALEVPVTFDTGGPDMTPQMLVPVGQFIADLAGFDSVARNAISADFDESNDSASRLYLSHHIDELADEERILCFGTDNTNLDLGNLLSSLKLKRVGLYPTGESNVATFDYSIGQDITDYVLCVEFSAAGKILDVSMES